MKIGVDYSALMTERAGVGEYTYNLIKALLEVDDKNSYMLYVLYSLTSCFLHPSLKGKIPRIEGADMVYKYIPVPYQLMRYLWLPGMPRCLEEYMLGGLDVDVVHSTTFSVPRFRDKRKKLVVTIYDLTVLTHPDCHKRINVDHCLGGIKDAIKYADAIIAISNHTKADLVNYLKAPEELITVVHLAAGAEFFEVKDAAILSAVRARYKLPERYILFLGSLEPRKNIKNLLKAYANLKEGTRKEYSLVIAGAMGWKNNDISQMIDELALADKVRFTGYIKSNDLSALYSSAALFVYPSLYEGFGLPILEAFACGCPVITSNVSSMPEVAGDAARLVSPLDVQDITIAMEEMLGDESLRNMMRMKGFERSAEFTWARCARETLKVYEKAYVAKRRW